MGAASFAQTSFLGGEWSPQMQGRFDREDYRTGLNVCLNVIPIEEGSAPRRSGTRVGSITRSGRYAVLREYTVDQAQPYVLELTPGHLRIWQAGAALATYAGTLIKSYSGGVFTTATNHGMSTGDQAVFTVGSATTYANIAPILGRQLEVTVTSSSTFTIVDALTGAAVDPGSLMSLVGITNLKVLKIVDLQTPYTQADLQQVRVVQDGTNALLLHPSYAPRTFIIATDSSGNFAGATLTTTAFYDGPYLDIPTDGTTLTPSGTSGSITFTASAITSINGGQGFLSSDIGRMFRVFSEPAAWVSTAAYVKGNIVKDGGTYWQAVASSTGVQPSADNGTNWVINPEGAAWTWGTIQSVTSSVAFVGTLHAAVTYPDNTAGGNLLYTVPITAWQLGAYGPNSGYPAVGAYFQGRVWLGGAIKNRFDACVSNDFAKNGYVNFAPTGLDGTVADNNAIAGTLNSKEIENFLWMLPDEQGVLAGTQSGEWIIASSSSGEPITPTSILARETSKYGSANVQAIKINRATIFAHRDGRKVYEYMANYFTQKFVADNLSLKAKHLTEGGIAELAYMRELTPVIWVRLNNGGLIGCTYKHDDPIKPLEFAGWHRHTLGTGRSVVSIQGGPANGGETDTLSMITQDPATNYCYVEFLQTIWDASDDLVSAWYLDGGIGVAAAELISANVIRLYGLWYMAGATVSVWGAGLDLGDFTITANGTLDLTLNATNSLFTSQLLAQISAQGCRVTSVDVAGSGTTITAYKMEAKENYDSARVSYINGLTTYNTGNVQSVFLCAQNNHQGIQWDPVRRNLMYMYAENTPQSPTTNTSGYTLWDGANTHAPGSGIDPGTLWNSSVGVKNIDSGVVTYYSNYNSANTVPSGIGGGTGSYRRCTKDFEAYSPTNGGNGPGMTDPYTGNFWVNSQSCELYCFRLADNYSQIISPLAPVQAVTNDVSIVGFTTQGATGPWTFAREIDYRIGNITTATSAYLYLVPKDITAVETTHDYLLAYATFTYPRQELGNYYRICNREIFDHAGNMFVFSCASSGGKAFKLHKFTLPTSAPYGGPIVGGGFTDITPWGGSTGPNGDAAGYTLKRSDTNFVTGNFYVPKTASVIPMYLPATDDLVLIEKFLPSEKTANSTDPSLMFWSCTYVHSPAGTPTFDHHSQFVTGYMSGAWAPTTQASAAYAVVDAFEINNYLGQSDYDYSYLTDYTKRWFAFLCTKMTGGVSDNSTRIVFVEYQFVRGSAPTVVQVIDELGWDTAYPKAAKSSNAYTVSQSGPGAAQACNAVAAAMDAAGFNYCYPMPLWDHGVYDPVTNAFWWSGGATDSGWGAPNNGGSQAFFSQFDPKFVDRMQRADGTPGPQNVGAVPPFLKLSFGSQFGFCSPFVVGNCFTSQGQILRPVTPNESMTQSGPSLGKLRRSTYAGVLFNNAQGVSMGVDFLQMRGCAFKSPGGTVNLTLAQTFSGVYWNTVDANSNYDNMWCWQVTRPYPCTVVAVELQHKANENV